MSMVSFGFEGREQATMSTSASRAWICRAGSSTPSGKAVCARRDIRRSDRSPSAPIKLPKLNIDYAFTQPSPSRRIFSGWGVRPTHRISLMLTLEETRYARDNPPTPSVTFAPWRSYKAARRLVRLPTALPFFPFVYSFHYTLVDEILLHATILPALDPPSDSGHDRSRTPREHVEPEGWRCSTLGWNRDCEPESSSLLPAPSLLP